MRRARRAFTCVSVLLLLASAQEAYAAWGWLEKLSGPGPFYGWDYPTIPIACQSGEKGDAWRPGCDGYQTSGKGTVILSLSFSDYKGDNFLPYAEAKDRTVTLKSWVVSLDLRLHPGLDVGVGLGLNGFSGDDFGGFSRLSFDALRIVWRPVGLFAPRHEPIRLGGPFFLSLRDLVQVKLRATIFPSGFKASDFNAMGTFDERAELLLGASVTLGVVIWW